MIKIKMHYNINNHRTTVNISKTSINKTNLNKMKTSKEFYFVTTNEKNHVFVRNGDIQSCEEVIKKMFNKETK